MRNLVLCGLIGMVLGLAVGCLENQPVEDPSAMTPETIRVTGPASEPLEGCLDGMDNDGDGLADCADPDCHGTSACAPIMSEDCDNGLDDDGDGAVDCNDADCDGYLDGCVDPSEICFDNVDNDGDGAVDCADSDCATHSYCSCDSDGICEPPLENGVFCADCSSLPLCGDGLCNGVETFVACPGDCPAPATENCSNTTDDDADGLADCDDPDCKVGGSCGLNSETCDNGVDDDADGKVDCVDPDCLGWASCPAPVEICDDGIDNDVNGALDCADPLCVGFASCPPPVCNLDGVCTTPETNAACPLDCFCNSDSVCDAHEAAYFCADCKCGNGVCDAPAEDATSCSVDCSAVPLCGNGTCLSPETTVNCPVDCSVTCGNALCELSENPTTCPGDCPTTCGNGTCAAPETSASCPVDCPASCGNALCDSAENPTSCPADCMATCGNSVCDAPAETSANCAKDCAVVPLCGNGACVSPESSVNCPADCSATCGDTICDPLETASTCPGDCSDTPSCNNGVCQPPTETSANCPWDCSAVPLCGNGVCAGAENSGNCPADCGSCGDTICSSTETASTCALDCGSVPLCNNGVCNAPAETSANCPSDCASVPNCGNGVCASPETNATCPSDCTAGESNATLCQDGIDNDGDSLIDAGDSQCLDQPVATLNLSRTDPVTSVTYRISEIRVHCPGGTEPDAVIGEGSINAMSSINIWALGNNLIPYTGKVGCEVWVTTNGFQVQTNQKAGVWLPDTSQAYPLGPLTPAPDDTLVGYDGGTHKSFGWTSCPTCALQTANILLLARPNESAISWW